MEKNQVADNLVKTEVILEQDIKAMNIYQKLSNIINELNRVSKNIVVKLGSGSYKAVAEADVLDAVKPLEWKYHIYSYPVTRTIIESGTIEDDSRGTKKLFERIESVYRFINIDNPSEFIDITSYGDGIDSGDKSVGKAMTYADKYALLKCYKIQTGDDPDQNPSVDIQKYEKKEQKSEQGVSPAQLSLIRSLNVNEINVCLRYHIDNIEQLTKAQADFVIKTKQENVKE